MNSLSLSTMGKVDKKYDKKYDKEYSKSKDKGHTLSFAVFLCGVCFALLIPPDFFKNLQSLSNKNRVASSPTLNEQSYSHMVHSQSYSQSYSHAVPNIVHLYLHRNGEADPCSSLITIPINPTNKFIKSTKTPHDFDSALTSLLLQGAQGELLQNGSDVKTACGTVVGDKGGFDNFCDMGKVRRYN